MTNGATQVRRIKLPRRAAAKDPNDLELRGLLKGAVESALASAGQKEEAPFPFWYAAELGEIEAQNFLVEDWLPRGGVSVLYAPKDCLKSFVAVDLFMSVVAGVPWHGFDVEQGIGIYIAGEGNTGLRKRFKAWAIRHEQDVEALPFALSKWPMQALDPDNISLWSDHVARVEEHYGAPARFIVVDTLATNFGPGDENAPTDMARFLANLVIHLKRESDATILVVHHTGKDSTRGARGGSSLEMNSECVFEIRREVEKGQEWNRLISLHCKHTKDGARPETMLFKGVPVELGVTDRHGEQLTSLVLEPELTQRELAVLNNTHAGMSQRQIADFLSVSKTVVHRIQASLRDRNLLSSGCDHGPENQPIRCDH